MNENKNNGILPEIKSYWFLIMAVVAIIVGWTSFGNDLAITKAQAQENKSALIDYNNRLINVEANIFLLCKAQKLDCIPPSN